MGWVLEPVRERSWDEAGSRGKGKHGKRGEGGDLNTGRAGGVERGPHVHMYATGSQYRKSIRESRQGVQRPLASTQHGEETAVDGSVKVVKGRALSSRRWAELSERPASKMALMMEKRVTAGGSTERRKRLKLKK
eukprot:TRINITY_DN11990_c0_g1_i1.p1 TRINITY_DN11990_c0_g1~~TRINITY_DN11990_c0_g1_i1.p1  ORF type:complete len:135 (-),score=20.83 TRINITY_DN11990_c0_g1_i1:480-884(-)